MTVLIFQYDSVYVSGKKMWLYDRVVQFYIGYDIRQKLNEIINIIIKLLATT